MIRISELLCLGILLFNGVVFAEPEPLHIGDTFTLESKILNETRRLNVYLPAAYSSEDQPNLPVLYMPDGGIKEDFLHIAGLVQILSLNTTMRPFILVGIENTHRRRDLSGPTEVARDRLIAPVVGGSAAYRAFIRDELMPHIEANYRTTEERAIVGESAAGLFVVETLILEPEMFDTYIAVDPSLWWNDKHLVKTGAAQLRSHPNLRATLYMASSATEGISESTTLLAENLRKDGPKGLTVFHTDFTEDFHHTVYHPAALEAFRLVLAPKPEPSKEP